MNRALLGPINIPGEVWKVCKDGTSGFCALGATTTSVEDFLEPLQKLVVLLYDHTSSETSVNKAWKQLFTQK